MKKIKSILSGCLGLLFLLGADQASKYWAVENLKGSAGIPVVPGVFEFYYLENDGAAFGMLDKIQGVFILTAVLILLLCLYTFLRLPEDRRYRPLKILCVVIGAGAAGNMLDRLMFGYVIDFLYVSLIDFLYLIWQTVISVLESLFLPFSFLRITKTTASRFCCRAKKEKKKG